VKSIDKGRIAGTGVRSKGLLHEGEVVYGGGGREKEKAVSISRMLKVVNDVSPKIDILSGEEY
jgi:hypothetical protein